MSQGYGQDIVNNHQNNPIKWTCLRDLGRVIQFITAYRNSSSDDTSEMKFSIGQFFLTVRREMNQPGKDVDISQWDKKTIAHLFLHFFTLRSIDGGCYDQFNISVNALMFHGPPVPPWSCSGRGVEQKSSGMSQVPWDPHGTAAIAEGQKPKEMAKWFRCCSQRKKTHNSHPSQSLQSCFPILLEHRTPAGKDGKARQQMMKNSLLQHIKPGHYISFKTQLKPWWFVSLQGTRPS